MRPCPLALGIGCEYDSRFLMTTCTRPAWFVVLLVRRPSLNVARRKNDVLLGTLKILAAILDVGGHLSG